MSRILIVDDAAFMRMMLKDILEKNGYQVIGDASNGLKAVELYKKDRPDIKPPATKRTSNTLLVFWLIILILATMSKTPPIKKGAPQIYKGATMSNVS